MRINKIEFFLAVILFYATRIEGTVESALNPPLSPVGKKKIHSQEIEEYVPVQLLSHPAYFTSIEIEDAVVKIDPEIKWEEITNEVDRVAYLQRIMKNFLNRLSYSAELSSKCCVFNSFPEDVLIKILQLQNEASNLCFSLYEAALEQMDDPLLAGNMFMNSLISSGGSINNLCRIGIDRKFVEAVKNGESISPELEKKMWLSFPSNVLEYVDSNMFMWEHVFSARTLNFSKTDQKFLACIDDLIQVFFHTPLNICSGYCKLVYLYEKIEAVNEILNIMHYFSL